MFCTFNDMYNLVSKLCCKFHELNRC
uniref:Uncharacterized protein n=1 Tax=Arundo donax TaxID=35708 RepID=A0A0A9GQA9_ARUDO